MKYCKIKPEYDNRRRSDGSIIVGNELYTAKEIKKYNINPNWYDIVSVKPDEKYWFFGARMSIRFPYLPYPET